MSALATAQNQAIDLQLGRHTSLSPALLSKIERGRLHPTLSTLMRIAMVFGVGPDFFFAEDKSHPLLAIARTNASSFRTRRTSNNTDTSSNVRTLRQLGKDSTLISQNSILARLAGFDSTSMRAWN